jgi:putative ABC transport system permease protein
VGDVRATLWLLLGAVGLVLVIACVNIANMLAVMGLSRRGELAVKAALGAGSGRLVRGPLVESMLLVSVGGALGVGLAALAVPALASVLPPDLPRRDDVTLNAAVVAFGIGMTVLTSVLVGLIPALQASRLQPAHVMGEAGRSVAGGWGRALRSGFVAGEVALSFVLMVGAGLLGGSFERLWHVDRGFDTEGLIEAVVLPDHDRYPERADRDRFSAALRERFGAIPGVEVSATSQVPLSGSASSTTYLVDRADAPPDSANGVLRSEVLDNYFDVMRIPIVQGRSFRPTDVADAPPVAIVNEAMAHELWPGASPLGKRVRHDEDDPWMTVVGVARDVRHMRLDTPVEPKLYLPAPQSSQTATSWVVRAQGNLPGVVQRVRDAVAEVSPDTPVWRVQILQERIASSVAVPRFRAGFVVGLAGMAAVLALLGVYGVTSFAVSQRTREIGVRIALGSEPDAVVRRIVLQALRLTGVGLALGLAVAIPASRLVTRFLYEIQPHDPATFAVTASLVGGISVLAAFVPARRAAAVDPVVVLKAE